MPNQFKKDKLLLWWLPAFIAIIGSIASFYCWTLLDNREHEYIRQTIRSDVSSLADKSARLMKERVFSLQRIADRWIMRGGMPKDEWLADMNNHLRHFSGFQAIEWIDATYHVRWIAPLEGNEQAQDLDIAFDANRKDALEEAKRLNEACIIRNIDLVQGGKGCIVFIPLYIKERFDGFIAGVLNYRKFFESHIPADISSHYVITIYEGNERIYALNPSDYPDTASLSQSVEIEFYSKKWRFEASPLPERSTPIYRYWDEMLLPIGIAIAFLTAGIIYFYQKKSRSEKYLRHSEECLKIAQEIAHVGSWEWNIIDNSEVWSDEQFRIFGYEPGTVTANYDFFLKALHPEDKERVLQAVHESLHNKAPYQIEYRIVRPTNETRIVYARGTVYRNIQGKPVRMVGTVHDVTDYKRLEAEIQAIARLPTESPNPIIRLANDGKILFTNKAGLFILENCCCYTTQPCKVGDTVKGKWLEYINKALETNNAVKEDEVVSKHIYTLTFVPITDQKYVNIYGVDVTARRHIVEALATSEKRYRTLSEVSPVGIFYTDVEGKWVYGNKQIPVLTGMHMSEAVGDGWMSALHPGDAQRVSQEWLKSIRERTGFSSEYRFVNPAGKTIWVYSQATPEKDQAGATIGYVGTVTDITGRKQTEEKLKKITESTFDAIIIIDEDGAITYWNHAAETLFGYAKDEAIGKDVHTLIVPADYANAYQHGMIKFKARGTGDLLGKKIVLPAQKKDGTQFYAEHSFAAFQSNNRWNAVSIIRDYTERKQYEEALKRLNETLEQRVTERTKEILAQNEKLVTLSRAVEQSSTCIVITDANGTIEYVNPQFAELTGYILAEAKGQNPRILKSGQTPPERFKELWETITAGETWHGEFTNKKKNGEIYHELGTISPIKNAEGKITHFVAIKNDISGLKSLEAERKRLEDQLSHAQKLESIGKLAGGIAHDFNNMLMAVVGYSNLIQMELAEDNHLRNYTKKILDLTDKSKRLTQSLLTFGRRQPLYLGAVDLNDLVRDLEPLLFQALGERIRCEMPLSEKSIAIKADSSKLEQVVLNIFMNAVEAMPSGGRLTIRTAVTELDGARAKSFGLGAAGAYALLSVSDTGVGMDKATQEKIFEPFFTTKSHGKGTGLGLAIAYGIVKQHNGAIEVISKPGKGATFNIYLPISAEKLKEGVAAAENRLPSSSPLPSTQRKTILLAEDEEGVRDSLTMVLRQKGFTVITAVDGEDAINKFEQNKDTIDLLLLDGIMPVKSGKEAYDNIRKIKPGVKALFLSGYTGDEEANRKIQEEGLRFLQKPVPLPELMDAIWGTIEA